MFRSVGVEGPRYWFTRVISFWHLSFRNVWLNNWKLSEHIFHLGHPILRHDHQFLMLSAPKSDWTLLIHLILGRPLPRRPSRSCRNSVSNPPSRFNRAIWPALSLRRLFSHIHGPLRVFLREFTKLRLETTDSSPFRPKTINFSTES